MLTLTVRVSRWRPDWLLLPAMAGTCWLAAVRMTASVAALEAGSGRLIAAELAAALHPGRFLHSAGQVGAAAQDGAGWWLPLALLAGTAEAAVVLWLGRRRFAPAWRPGAIAVVRRRVATAALAASHTVTASGCAIGVNPSSGRLVGFSWTEAERGVLLAGPDEGPLGQLGLAVAGAATRLRKTVVVIGSTAGPAGQVAVLARRLGVPVTKTGALESDTAGSMGRAIRSRHVLVVPADEPEAERLAVAHLSGVLDGLRDLGLRADCLAYVTSCERLEPECLAGLVELGQATGTCVLLSTTSEACMASLVSHVGTTAQCGRAVSAERGRAVSPGTFTLSYAGRTGANISGTIVPIALASGSAALAQAP